jgi:hypothetical protein
MVPFAWLNEAIVVGVVAPSATVLTTTRRRPRVVIGS